MHHVNGARRLRGWRSILSATSFLFLLSALAPSAFGQDAPAAPAPADTPQANQELSVTDILKLPGRVLGEGQNARAVGQRKVKSYRVEEVTLPQMTEVEIKGEKRTVGRAFRVTVTGGPFPVRAMPPVIWVDDTAVGFGVENEELTEITAITYDDSLLVEGATLYLSYGDKKDKEDRTALPEKLTLGGPKGGNQ